MPNPDESATGSAKKVGKKARTKATSRISVTGKCSCSNLRHFKRNFCLAHKFPASLHPLFPDQNTYKIFNLDGASEEKPATPHGIVINQYVSGELDRSKAPQNSNRVLPPQPTPQRVPSNPVQPFQAQTSFPYFTPMSWPYPTAQPADFNEFMAFKHWNGCANTQMPHVGASPVTFEQVGSGTWGAPAEPTAKPPGAWVNDQNGESGRTAQTTNAAGNNQRNDRQDNHSNGTRNSHQKENLRNQNNNNASNQNNESWVNQDDSGENNQNKDNWAEQNNENWGEQNNEDWNVPSNETWTSNDKKDGKNGKKSIKKKNSDKNQQKDQVAWNTNEPQDQTWGGDTQAVDESATVTHDNKSTTAITTSSIQSGSKSILGLDSTKPYTKSYWSEINSRSTTVPASYGTAKGDVLKARAAFYPEARPRAVSQDVADRAKLSHQVQAGQGILYDAKKVRPKYIDSFEKPYAVFVFKYRSKEKIDEIFGGHPKEDKYNRGNWRDRMQEASKEDLIENMIKMKKALGHGENSSVSSETGEQDGEE